MRSTAAVATTRLPAAVATTPLRVAVATTRFILAPGGGNDTVTDFQNGFDKFDVTALVSSFASVTVTTSGSDVVLGFGSGSPTIRVQNTSASAIDSSDFIFGSPQSTSVTVTWRDASVPFQMSAFSFTGFSTVTNASETSFRWNNADGGFWTATGSGFAYDGNNRPIVGTITSIDGTNGNGQPGLLMTGATISASQLAAWVAANDPVSFLKSTLGGTDTITGNGLDDSLSGYSGNDGLQGGVGNDTLAGGSGSDTLSGGAGSDTADYRDFGVDNAGAGTQGVTVSLTAGTATDNWNNGDTLTSIENVNGSNLADSITGDSNANNLSGFGGNDTLGGGAGNDWLRGGSGNDTIVGHEGVDTVDYGYDGFDSAGAPTQGVVVSLPGAEATDNWGNTDVLIQVENVNGSALDDTIGGDGVANILFGLAGNDTITGGGGDDTLDGGDGNDSLSASIGNDTLRGGSGNDTLTGGTGSDIFVIGAGDGNDTVTDFENGIDKIHAGTLATSFAGVTVTQDGSDVVVGFGSGSPTMRLQNISAASIDASDFLFGVAAQITGNITGSVTEKGGVANGTAGVATATGNLDVTDSDGPETFVVQSAVAKTYGTFSIDATGAWSYTLDETTPTCRRSTRRQPLHDLVTVSTADGTTQVIDITINGANDAAVITGTVTGSVTESERRGQRHARHGDGRPVRSAMRPTSTARRRCWCRTALPRPTARSRSMPRGMELHAERQQRHRPGAGRRATTLHELVTVGDGRRHDAGDRHHDQRRQRRGGDHRHGDGLGDREGAAWRTARPAMATATGTRVATDVDSAATFAVQNGVAKTYGTFSIDATGAWSYTLDDEQRRRPGARHAARTLHELVTVATADGTTQVRSTSRSTAPTTRR